MLILRIPQQSVNSLMSSSSIFSTSSVVKELIDNAIDAESNDIKIELDNETGGLKYCSVQDNGVGVNSVDRDLMCLNCTTSKLSNEESNLFNHSLSKITTLGFRGEALFFISQLIQLDSSANSMVITTKTKNNSVGEKWNISSSGEVQGNKKTIPMGTGTTIKLVGLFTSFIVRRKILLKQAQKLIDEVRYLIFAYSLAYPKLRISLKLVDVIGAAITQNKTNLKKNLVLSHSSNRISILGQLCKIRNWKKSFFAGTTSNEDEFDNEVLFSVEYVLPIMSGNSEISTIKMTNQYLSVNGRPLDKSASILFKEIIKILMEIYSSLNLLKPPTWCLNFEFPSEDIDVNIEPLKNDVMIYKQNHFLSSLQAILENVVREAHGVSTTELQNLDEEIIDTPEKELPGPTFTVSNHQPSPEIEEITIDRYSDKPSSDETHILPTNLFVQPELIDVGDDSDWQFNTHLTFSQEQKENSNTSGAEDKENEDLTITHDINLSNPFIFSKIAKSNSSLSELQIEENNNTTLVPEPDDTTKKFSPIRKDVKDILTGNSKRKAQRHITELLNKKQKIAGKNLVDLSEDTMNLEILVEIDLKSISFDYTDYNVQDDQNWNLLSWYTEIGEQLSHGGGGGGLVIEEGDTGVRKLNYK